MKPDMCLASSVKKFSDVLVSCEITKKNGVLLEQEDGLMSVMQVLARVRERKGSVYIIGNGGSASIASHAAIDLLHVAGMRAFTLHDSALITCMANDYGYEHSFSRVLEQVFEPDDVLIAISSSGNSLNIRNSVAQVIARGGVVITLSGFANDNPLRCMGNINIWLDAMDYGLVEIGHQFILHNISDRFGQMK